MTKPLFVSLDFETRSVTDLRKTGVYRYVEDPTTDVWCAAFTVGNDSVQVWHLGDDPPDDLHRAVNDGAYIKAWNASFERIIWRDVMVPKHGWPELPNDRFVCSMVAGAAAGLPMNLEEAAIVLGLEEQKDMAGARLMMQMAKPRRMEDGVPVWWDDADRRRRLAEYCAQDVRTECAVWRRLPPCMNASERRLYLLDQTINDRGVPLDLDLVRAARKLSRKAEADADAEMAAITKGLVSSVTKIGDLKTWVNARGVATRVLDKARVAELLEGEALPTDVRRALEIRAEAAKTSVKKYDKMLDVACADGRARGLLQFYGAGTGRWAGRLIQPQNFPKGTVKVTPEIIQSVKDGTLDADVMEVLSSTLRGAIIAPPGRALYVADFNAIEARVVAWLAGERKLVDLFAKGGKVYEAMAARIFGKRADEIEKGPERDLGKMAVLGCGFGMGPRKFAAQANVDEGLAQQAVAAYRDTYPRIKQFWYDLDDAAVRAVKTGLPQRVGRLSFRRVRQWLAMDLPSGRSLWYYRPRIVMQEVPWGGTKPCVEIDVRDGLTRQWVPQRMYGGIWAENATQATARDLMAAGMLAVEAADFAINLTVHDELVTNADPSRDLDEFVALLSVVPEWATGCPIKAEGWTGDRYRK